MRSARSTLTGLALTGLALTALGCSSLAPEDDTYLKTVQGLDPAAQSADWSCLGQPAQPPPALPDGAMVTYTFPLVEWVTSQPIPGRTVQVCNRIDPMCSTPLSPPIPVDDNQANVSLQLRAGLSLFLLIKAPNVLDYTLYFDGPLYSDQDGGKISLLRLDTAVGLAQQVQVALDPTLGVLAMRPHDCRGNIVSGALYSIDATNGSSVPYAFSNGLPRAANPPVPAVSTNIPSDNTPWAGFVNVPPIGLTVYGILADGMREFGTADVSVRPFAVNVVEVRALNHL